MSLRETLYSVVRSVLDQYDTYPMDLDDAREVHNYLTAQGNTDLANFQRLERMTLRAFIQIDVDSQWQASEDALWTVILLKTRKQIAKPEFWTPDATLLDLAVYVEIA